MPSKENPSKLDMATKRSANCQATTSTNTTNGSSDSPWSSNGSIEHSHTPDSSSAMPTTDDTHSDPPSSDPSCINDCWTSGGIEDSMPWWRHGEQQDLVISGISGRFPESDNVEEFAEHILNGHDLITEDDRRWEPGFYGLPARHGKLKDLSRFDAQFFGVPPKQADFMDPQLRILLEVVHEAILDSGYNPMQLRGSKIGVFVGCSASETASGFTQDPETINGYTLTGCTRSMFANRVSYAFDLRGPSFAVDTACSSSCVALQLAVDAIRQDQCEAAIVAGTHLTLVPNTALQFLRLNMLSSDGASKSFDASGNGYVRGEGIVAILIQKSSDVRRCYATVVHAKSNTDGYKQHGITFPSGEQQAVLLEEVYREAGIDPRQVAYVETHGTGTKVGDPQEANAICEVFCRDRDQPLLIGSVKSSMGHAEPASGLCAVAKVLIAMEKGIIPPNLHYKEPNPYVPGLADGRMKVVVKPTIWKGGLVGINSFGFGGSNSHILLRSRHQVDRPSSTVSKLDIPKLFCYSSRTESGMESTFNAVHEHQSNPNLYALLSEQSSMNPAQCPYRGYTLMNRDAGVEPISSTETIPTVEHRPVWFIYSGMGTQWAGMGRDLMRIESFKQSVLRCSEALRKLGVDPYSLIMKGDGEVFKDTMHCMVCIAAIQIAITDVLKTVDVVPEGIVGHSTGEMACGYADGGLTLEQTMLLAYYRGDTVKNGGLSGTGGMAAIGLSWEAVKQRLPDGVVAACHNGADSVTISGDYEKVLNFVDEMKREEIFAKFVDSSGVPFHSPAMLNVKPQLSHWFSTVISEPVRRSKRWISSSVPESSWSTREGEYCSAEYHVNNAMNPVLFYEALQHVPENAVAIEIAPHSLLQAILRRTLPASCSSIGMMSAKGTNQVESFLSSIGKVHQAGVCVKAQNLYAPVPYPVPKGTPMIAPLVQWDHSIEWPVLNAKDMASNSAGGVPCSCSFTIDPFEADSKDKYLLDHVIDGRTLYPFTGYLVLAWRTISKLRGEEHLKTPVIFEDVNVFRPTILTKKVRFDVVISPCDGHFEVLEGGAINASGRIHVVDEPRPFYYKDLNPLPPTMACDRVMLNTKDIYKEFMLRGYEYGSAFRGLHETRNSGLAGTLYWKDNWVTFLDALLQSALLAERQDTLRLPVRLRYMRIDPLKHSDHVEIQNNVEGDTQIVQLRNDIATNGCTAGGVEVCDLISQNVQRRMQTIGKLHLERIYFVEHKDSQCFSLFPMQSQKLIKYTEILKSVAAQGLRKLIKLQLIKHFPNEIMITEASTSFKTSTTTVNEAAVNDLLHNEAYAWLNSLHSLFNVSSSTVNDEKFRADFCTRAKELSYQLTTDPLHSAALSQRPLKPLLDIAMESAGVHSFQFCAVEPVNTDTIRYIHDLQMTHPLIEIQWSVIGGNVDSMRKDLVDLKDCCSHNLDDGVNSIPSAMVNRFNTIVIDHVLHKKADIARYLQRLTELVKDEGFALVVEPTSNFELHFTMEGMYETPLPAIGDGQRKYGMYLDHTHWLREFQAGGWDVVAFQTDIGMSSTLYLLRKVPTIIREPLLVNVDDNTDFKWIEPLQKAIDYSMKNQKSTVWLTNNEVRDNGSVGMALCLREESGKLNRIRSIVDVSLKRDTPFLDIDLQEESLRHVLGHNLHANNYRDGKWGSFRHLVIAQDELYAYKNVQHAYINTLTRGDLSSLNWVESSNQFFECQNRSRKLKLCSVYMAAINFRDVMLASGRLPPDAIPGEFADRDCLLGLEFSGRYNDSGKRVMGILPARGLATSVVTDPEYAWPVPDNWTLQEAATIPVVYSTAYYALVIRGRIRKRERVLIHSGTGGVGQAAIAVALSYGCEVFTTVSSDEKKQFLMKRFPQLRESNFSNSRTTEFEWHVRQSTQGKGVDMVLNSLSEDKLQASLRCLAQHGRFLEIGKFDLSRNAQLGMSLFLKNITFHGILLDALMDGNNPDWQDVSKLLQQGIIDGVVKPLTSSVYPSAKVEDAFRYMASGKHIGKVLVQVRPEEPGVCLPSVITVKAVSRAVCHPLHSYLITGGLGGFGLELAQWLINHGARKIVLTSRSGIRTGYQARCLYFWRRTGIQVMVSTLDIADAEDCERLIEQCEEMGPLGGVFHLAMVLRDTLFENQHVDNFKQAAQAKYIGTKNLDAVTRKRCDLQWFVAFSSITSGRGNGGQTNYGWANSTMERVMEQRVFDGYPGIAIQWGAIGDVGVIIENMGNNSTIVGGTVPQRMPSCLQCLDLFLSWNHPIVSSFVRADVGAKSSTKRHGDVIQAIAHIIGVKDVKQLNMSSTLGDLGLDSLMGVEIKQTLERDFDIMLSMKDIRTLTLTKLKNIAEGTEDHKPQPEDERTAANKQAEMERQMNELFKLRMDVNDLLSFDKLPKINEISDDIEPSVFFVHSIEGIASPLKKLAAQLTVPAYCFQCTPSCPMESIEAVACYYINTMKEQEPRGPYHIVGYSYGACIAFEMALQLQAESDGQIGSITLLDGSHHYMKAYRRVYRMAYGVSTEFLTNNPIFEAELMASLAMRLSSADYKALRAELIAKNSWKERQDHVTAVLMQGGLFNSSETVAWICESLRAKFLMADKYEPKAKFGGDVTLLRAENSVAASDDIGADYGLGEAVSGNVTVHSIEGDHDSFVQGDTSSKTAEHITQIVIDNL